jgi:hypothetical protein
LGELFLGELFFGRAPASKQPQINAHRPPPTPKKNSSTWFKHTNTKIQKYNYMQPNFRLYQLPCSWWQQQLGSLLTILQSVLHSTFQ